MKENFPRYAAIYRKAPEVDVAKFAVVIPEPTAATGGPGVVATAQATAAQNSTYGREIVEYLRTISDADIRARREYIRGILKHMQYSRYADPEDAFSMSIRAVGTAHYGKTWRDRQAFQNSNSQ